MFVSMTGLRSNHMPRVRISGSIRVGAEGDLLIVKVYKIAHWPRIRENCDDGHGKMSDEDCTTNDGPGMTWSIDADFYQVGA